jgi:hypothetical protein
MTHQVLVIRSLLAALTAAMIRQVGYTPVPLPLVSASFPPGYVTETRTAQMGRMRWAVSARHTSTPVAAREGVSLSTRGVMVTATVRVEMMKPTVLLDRLVRPPQEVHEYARDHVTHRAALTSVLMDGVFLLAFSVTVTTTVVTEVTRPTALAPVKPVVAAVASMQQNLLSSSPLPDIRRSTRTA